MSTIEPPKLSLTLGLSAALLTAVGAAATYAAFLAGDASLKTRVVVSIVVAAVPISLYSLWFGYRWLRAHWRRSRSYPRLLRSYREEQTKRAELAATVAQAIGITPLSASKVIRRGNSTKLILQSPASARLEMSEVLLLVDVDVGNVLARAEVDHIDALRAEAIFTWFADPVAEGWFSDKVGPLGLALPAGTAVISESAVSKRLEQLVQSAVQEETHA